MKRSSVSSAILSVGLVLIPLFDVVASNSLETGGSIDIETLVQVLPKPLG